MADKTVNGGRKFLPALPASRSPGKKVFLGKRPPSLYNVNHKEPLAAAVPPVPQYRGPGHHYIVASLRGEAEEERDYAVLTSKEILAEFVLLRAEPGPVNI
ncbi:Hypothetical protein SMAX5B_022579 [Scophthalmus maximus]|uniref:Uncharacterized protein n=1 Tax=Scophthalmus maximus TaxID=52904 RepID=A0A2U9C218_SCOMX|nr:Hypothetical protein SMAX5B_022579 [Scophthalmus maximus]